MSNANPNSELMTIFNFTDEDLAANRSGRLSHTQAQRFQTVFEQQTSYNLSNMKIAAVVCLVFVIFMLTRFTDGSSNLLLFAIIFLLIVAGVIGLWQYLSRQQAQRAADDLQSTQAAAVTGTVIRLSDKQGGSVYVYPSKIGLRINHQEDDQLKAYLKHMPKETSFRVYYLPKTKRILSMEVAEA